MPEIKPLMKWISILSRYHQMEMAKRLEHLNIGMGQYPFLLEVCKCPGIRQDRLAEILCLNKSTAARAVTQLESAGYLERQVDPADKRAYCVYPTGAALEGRKAVASELGDLAAGMTSGLSREEQDSLHRMLEHMIHNVFPTGTGRGQSVTIE